MRQSTGNKYSRLIKVSIIIFILAVLFLNRGFRSLLRYNFRFAKLKKEIVTIKQNNAHLRQKIYYLQNDDRYIEYRIRKDLGYIKPGEVEFRFKSQ